MYRHEFQLVMVRERNRILTPSFRLPYLNPETVLFNLERGRNIEGVSFYFPFNIMKVF